MFQFVPKFISYMLGIIVMFTAPMLLVMLKADQTTQAYVQDVVEEFVDKSAVSGQISEASYMDFVNRLDSTGVTYDVNIIHSKEMVTPQLEEKDDGTFEISPVGKYNTYYEDHINGEIYEVVFPDNAEGKTYYMGYGDYLRVNVRNNTDTMGTKLLKGFNPTLSSFTIAGNYGAIVTHEQDKYNTR